MHDTLTAFAELLVGERIEVAFCHEPDESAQRLLATLGVVWTVDREHPTEWCRRCWRVREAKMARVSEREASRARPLSRASGRVPQAQRDQQQPDWIGFRASVANVGRRQDKGEQVPVCAGCGCELDGRPVKHSPRCEIGKLEEASHGADLLDRMDAGEPVRDDGEALELDEVAVHEEAAAASSSSGAAEVEEPSGSSDGAGRSARGGVAELGEEGPAASTGSPRVGGSGTRSAQNPYALARLGRGYDWTREAQIQAVQDFDRLHGRPPTVADTKGRIGMLPSLGSVQKVFVGWSQLIDQAGLTKRPRARSARQTESDLVGDALDNGEVQTESELRETVRSWIKVNGTGLVYRSPQDAYVAADEIEEDGRRAAEQAEFDDDHAKAEQARDQAHALAEKIRAAARAADPDSDMQYPNDLESQSRERAARKASQADSDTPPKPASLESDHETLLDSGRDDEEPGMAARTPAPLDLRTASPASGSPLQRLLAKLPQAELEAALDEIEAMRQRLEAEHALIASVLP